jgi:hypothetical protein
MSWKSSGVTGAVGTETEAVTVASTLSADTDIAIVDSTLGALAVTLPTGVKQGQRIAVLFEVDGGNLTFVVTNINNVATSLTLADAGDYVDFVWSTVLAKWILVGNVGGAVV